MTKGATETNPEIRRYDSADTIGDLPPPDTKRWIVRRKAMVVAAVRSGAITRDEACRRYALSVEEFDGWQRAMEMHGAPGLRVTRLQVYRNAPRARTGKNRGSKRRSKLHGRSVSERPAPVAR